MGRLEDMAKGMQLALDVTQARLEQDPDEVGRLIDSSAPGELAYAVAFLSDMYQDSLVNMVGDDRDRALEAFKTIRARGAADGDVVASQLRAMEHGGDDL